MLVRAASAAASPRRSCSARSPPARRTTSSRGTEIARRKMVREWGMSRPHRSDGVGLAGRGVPRRGPRAHPRLLRRDRPRHRRRGRAHPPRRGEPHPQGAHRAPPRARGGGARRCSSARPSTAHEVVRPRRRRDGLQGRRSRARASTPTAPRTIVDEPRRRRLALRTTSSSERTAHRCTGATADRIAGRVRAHARAAATRAGHDAAPRSGSGVVPGSRSSATAAQRSVAVNAPTNALPHDAVGVGDERHRDRRDLVAAMQRAECSASISQVATSSRLERPRAWRRGPGTSRTRPTRTARPTTVARDAGSRCGRAASAPGRRHAAGASGGRRRISQRDPADGEQDERAITTRTTTRQPRW